MLKNLQIAHYALIDTLDVDFNNGFSVITGETGAGKSIISRTRTAHGQPRRRQSH